VKPNKVGGDTTMPAAAETFAMSKSDMKGDFDFEGSNATFSKCEFFDIFYTTVEII
jgi:hypothetical protein